ncbi:DUF4286 family protein [Niabella beijingensis]|uniref:DUF4286 family protein n=1 Tax=Niabella beijingensis TaxID=2872700 RepID=UPI001CBE32BD|nr:DUF4286 family protein [Niabella beijingensis]MBZ4189941.1 DUF4286 family protein [Niabella beijingensis]
MKPSVIWNITTKVPSGTSESWLSWLREVYIPAFLETGCFYDAVVLKLMNQEEDGDVTYAVQFHARSEAGFEQFVREHHAALSKLMKNTWGGECYSFESALQVVN